jgi:hypothetical protein
MVLFLNVIAMTALRLAAMDDPLDAIEQRLPRAVAAWTARDAATRHNPETIYSYIDGHAEVYLAYGMQSCLTRRYLPPTGEAAIVLDVFAMASSADAFGVFSRDQDGDAIELGQEARVRSNWLSFWKGRFFVSIYAEDEAKGVREAVISLGKMTAAAIDDSGERPALLLSLPQDGLVARSIRYLHDPQLLRYHVPEIHGNPLSIETGTPVVLAEYRRGDERALLLIAQYVSPNAARAAAEAASEFFAQSPARPYRILHDRLAVVLRADTSLLAVGLLDDAGSLLSEGGSAR